MVPFLPQVIPAILNLMGKEPHLQEAVIIQLSRIFSAIGIYSREYVDDALKLIADFWSPHLIKPMFNLLDCKF